MKFKTATAIAAFILSPVIAQAGPEFSAMKDRNKILEMNVDTCVLISRTAFVKLRSKSDPQEEVNDLEKCTSDGKEAAKAAHTAVKATFKKKAPPAELTEWRLEWMAAFDAAVLQTGDTEGAYLRRVKEARAKVERATNKFEIATE